MNKSKAARTAEVVLRENDYWTFNGELFCRHHLTPRKGLHVATQDELPIPLEYIDDRRRTQTNLESDHEATVEDVWGPADKLEPDSWAGTTTFEILPYIGRGTSHENTAIDSARKGMARSVSEHV